MQTILQYLNEKARRWRAIYCVEKDVMGSFYFQEEFKIRLNSRGPFSSEPFA
jgi:hypothetical protein